MSRSQPKPKIIFKTLQELIKSSSLSKTNPSIVKQDLKCYTLPLRSVTEASTHSIKRSNSKHSIKSKEKPPQDVGRQGSIKKESDSGPSVSYEQIDREIGKIYEQMESYLHKSKSKVIDELRGEPSNRKVQAKVKQLQKMSDYLKHIIDVFTNQDSQILINQRKVLKETTKQNNNIDVLSRNHKKKTNSRFLHNSSQKKPSIYQTVLNCLN